MVNISRATTRLAGGLVFLPPPWPGGPIVDPGQVKKRRMFVIVVEQNNHSIVTQRDNMSSNQPVLISVLPSQPEPSPRG